MGEFIDQQERRPASERAINVKLVERLAAIGDAAARQDLQPIDQRHGFCATVRLDHACDHIEALGFEPSCAGQHRIGLAHPRGHAEIDFQAAACFPLRFSEQVVRVCSCIDTLRHGLLYVTARVSGHRARG